MTRAGAAGIQFNFTKMPPMSFSGVVTKAGFMNKTATVTVSRWVIDKKTGKRISRSKKFLVHDERNQLRMEDSVLIQNCPPVSARKRFTLEKVVRSPATERDFGHPTVVEPPAASPTPVATP